jgi:hypothetical protein
VVFAIIFSRFAKCHTIRVPALLAHGKHIRGYDVWLSEEWNPNLIALDCYTQRCFSDGSIA